MFPSLVRTALARDRKRVVLLQSCMRRRLARKELKGLKTEAKSVNHFKEVSYKLENKVVELTQNLQKRTSENKSLQSKLRTLEDQLQSWMAKYNEAETQARQYKAKAEEPSVARNEFEALESEKLALDEKLSSSLHRIEDQQSVSSHGVLEKGKS